MIKLPSCTIYYILSLHKILYTLGAALKTDLGYDIRMSERTHFRPYGALKMEYGKFNNIKEDRGEMRLEVKGNDYFSVKPEVGMEFRYVQNKLDSRIDSRL